LTNLSIIKKFPLIQSSEMGAKSQDGSVIEPLASGLDSGSSRTVGGGGGRGGMNTMGVPDEVLSLLSAEDDEQQRVDDEQRQQTAGGRIKRGCAPMRQMWQRDPLYTLYFEHMNKGRLKVQKCGYWILDGDRKKIITLPKP
jgi:hypothetical protein